MTFGTFKGYAQGLRILLAPGQVLVAQRGASGKGPKAFHERDDCRYVRTGFPRYRALSRGLASEIMGLPPCRWCADGADPRPGASVRKSEAE